MGAQQGHNMSLSVIKNVIQKLTTNQVKSFISEVFPLFDIALRQTMQERDTLCPFPAWRDIMCPFQIRSS